MEATLLHKTPQKLREKLPNEHVTSKSESPDAQGYFISRLIKLKDLNKSYHFNLRAYFNILYKTDIFKITTRPFAAGKPVIS